VQDRTSIVRKRKLRAYAQALGTPSYLASSVGLIGEGPIRDQDYARVLDAIAQHAPRDFALRFGTARRVIELGLLGHVILSCSTLREVVDVWMSHADAAGELVTVKAQIDDAAGLWTTMLHADRTLSAAARRFCIEEQTATFFAFCRDVTGHSYADFIAEVEHPAPADLAIPESLQSSLRFGCGRNRIAGPSAVLGRSPVGRDGETFSLLLGQLAHLEQGDSVRRGAISQSLLNYFLLGHSRIPTQADAAHWLGMSKRSLVLRLQEEGTSYSRILDQYRRRYAMALLDEGALCTKQIAHAVGFVHENSLRRAFRGWTGQSIGAWTGGTR
jgi:AraC-like DNA-binding protein